MNEMGMAMEEVERKRSGPHCWECAKKVFSTSKSLLWDIISNLVRWSFRWPDNRNQGAAGTASYVGFYLFSGRVMQSPPWMNMGDQCSQSDWHSAPFG